MGRERYIREKKERICVLLIGRGQARLWVTAVLFILAVVFTTGVAGEGKSRSRLNYGVYFKHHQTIKIPQAIWRSSFQIRIPSLGDHWATASKSWEHQTEGINTEGIKCTVRGILRGSPCGPLEPTRSRMVHYPLDSLMLGHVSHRGTPGPSYRSVTNPTNPPTNSSNPTNPTPATKRTWCEARFRPLVDFLRRLGRETQQELADLTTKIKAALPRNLPRGWLSDNPRMTRSGLVQKATCSGLVQKAT